MLLSLTIRDIVLIENLNLSWTAGLTTLTGETGAGKSILLYALGLATGARGEAGLVRQGCKQGSASAIFDCQNRADIEALLNDNDIPENDGELVLRRVQGADGKGRAYINDTPVSIGLLARFGQALVEIHGQNESQTLTDAAVQLDLLDGFANTLDLRDKTSTAFRAWQDAANALAEYQTQLEKSGDEIEHLQRSVEDLKRLSPKAGEAEELDRLRRLQQNAGKLTGALEAIVASLDGEAGAEAQLNDALRAGERAAAVDAEALGDVMASLDRARVEVTEALAQVQDVARRLSMDPAALEATEDRLFALRDIARKHRCEIDALPDLFVSLSARLASLDDDPAVLKRYQKASDEAQAQYQKLAADLRRARIAAALKLDQAVNAELPDLKLAAACFRTEISDAAEAGPKGFDRVRFLAQTNPGTPEGPIAKIASGGELARFMLALKVVLADADAPRCLIFDEVDVGVGGAVAEAVGSRLRQLAQHHQVLVVTHAPQVAARGQTHWRVQKNAADGVSLTSVEDLVAEHRREEIARMLSGAQVTDEARAAAEKLLEGEL